MPENELKTVDNGPAFSRLLIANRKRIYGFIYALVHDHPATEDLLQDVSAILWKKFDTFEEGTDFAAWAMCIARYTILNWRRKEAKRVALPLSDETLEMLADEVTAIGCQDDERNIALRTCIKKLPQRSQELIFSRYHREHSAQDIANNERRNVRSIYLRLEKTHGMLLDCINRTLWNNQGANL